MGNGDRGGPLEHIAARWSIKGGSKEMQGGGSSTSKGSWPGCGVSGIRDRQRAQHEVEPRRGRLEEEDTEEEGRSEHPNLERHSESHYLRAGNEAAVKPR